MIVTNIKTGENITEIYLELMEGKITSKEFEHKTGLQRIASHQEYNRKPAQGLQGG